MTTLTLLLIICLIFGFIEYINPNIDPTREGVYYLYYTINNKRKTIRIWKKRVN